MSKSKNQDPPPTNRLLAALPKGEYQRLLPQLEPVTLTFGKILHERGDIISHVYFPNDSLISLLSTVEDRSTLEVGMVGNEGMAGLSVFMGVDKASTRALVQGGGSAFRMKSTQLHKTHHTSSLHSLLHRYTHSLLIQISQSSACNRFHTAEARLARWLLMTADRLGSNQFRLTQDFLGHMVGIRREAVNKAVSGIQRAKLINYSRGAITILDRAGLEALSCSCYAIIKESEDFLNSAGITISPPGTRHSRKGLK